MGQKIIGTIIQPNELKAEVLLEDHQKQMIKSWRKQIEDILTGKDKRKIVYVGPCSIDDEELAIQYAKEVRRIQGIVKNDLLLVMRMYVEKPRTTYGWDGYWLCRPEDWTEDGIHDGDIINKQRIRIRKLGKDITQEEVPTVTEMLDEDMIEGMDDIYSSVAIGSRTSSSARHRKVASGLDIPVLVKNPMSGDIKEMVQNIEAVKCPHNYKRDGKWRISDGNPNTLGVLRGARNEGESSGNYSLEHLKRYLELMEGKESDKGLIVDLNHDNSAINDGKAAEKHARQPIVLEEAVQALLQLKEQGVDVDKLWRGIMIEGYNLDGKQSLDGEIKGLSRTDPCLGLENTEKLILRAAEIKRMLQGNNVVDINKGKEDGGNGDEEDDGVQVGMTGTNGGFK